MLLLSNAKEAAESNIFSIDVARSLAAQLATVLSHDHVHYRGYAHGVCRDPDSKTASADPSVPSYGVKPMCFVSLENDIALDEAKLLLSNFGVAFRPEDKPQFEAYT
ncbi:hypothetical protein E4U23_003726 [Claviceps purpurea]|nr:hypothetical protein E4U23_003726 [Claviceps purpurea]